MSTEAFAAATQLFAMATRANIETTHKLYYEKYYLCSNFEIRNS
jgi:hypothetical protein